MLHGDWMSTLWSAASPEQKNTSIVPENPAERQLEILCERNESFQKQGDERAVLEKITADLKVVKERSGRVGQEKAPFLAKKISLLSDLQQVLSEMVQIRQQTVTLFNEHRALLEQYKADPHFKTLRRIPKTAPLFDELRTMARAIADLKEKIDEYERSKRTIASDQDKRKKALADITKEFDEAQQQRENFVRDGSVSEDLRVFLHDQQSELLDYQLRLLRYKKNLAQLRYDENSERLCLIETKLLTSQKKTQIMSGVYGKIKKQVVVDGAQVRQAEDQLEKDRHDFLARRDVLQSDIRTIQPQIDDVRRQVDQVVEKYAISPADATALRHWSIERDRFKTRDEWEQQIPLGLLYTNLGLLETKRFLLESRLDEAKFALQRNERQVDILRTWYKMTQRAIRLNVGEELEREAKKYDSELSQLRVDVSELTARRDQTIDHLYRLNVGRDVIRALMGVLRRKRDLLFGENVERYTAAMDSLNSADEGLRKRIEVTTKLMESYAKSLAIVQETLKGVSEIVSELSTKSFWTRSDHSIGWRDLKNFWPDMARFGRDLWRMIAVSFSKLSVTAVFERITNYLYNPYAAFLLILRLLAILAFFLLAHAYLPDIRRRLLQRESRFWFLAQMRYIGALISEFIYNHFISLSIWVSLYAGVFLEIVPSVFSVFFYLLSIPYLIYVATAFFSFVACANADRGFCMVSQVFQHRFLLIATLLTYATIFLSFLRRAFLLCNYLGSQVPDIFMALNIILIQAAFIGLITKESLIGKTHVFGFVSRSSPLGRWLEDHLNHYYFAFLFVFFALIVMCNPYVGYGWQVIYVLTRLVMTACLIPLFVWLYERIKRIFSDFFFYYPDGLVVKERFAGGKSWYALFIIGSFVIFILLALFVIGRVWGQGIGWKDISAWFHYSLYRSGIDEVTGNPIQITILSLFQIVLYVLGGIGIVYVINRFVLRRIFDPLLVGAGVQSTIMTLGRYVIVVMAFLIGLQSVGLDSMATKLIVVIAGVSYIIKEPIADFFSYFIILVQRPVKIGDYIQMEEPEVAGVVRHITPRSTIIRTKNSYTYVVPNSMLVTKVIQNWHYSRSFVATDDIEVMIPYSADPEIVKKYLSEVVDQHPMLLKSPVPIIWLTDFSDNGFKFMVRAFLSTDRVMDKWDIESQLRFSIIKKLREKGISLASPVRILTIQNTSEDGMPK